MSRTCYTSDMHFFRDAPARTIKVRWYFVPLQRPTLGLQTLFVQRNWDRHTGFAGLGELPRTWPYYNGVDVVHLDGTGLCGSAEQWLEGCRTTDPVPAIDPVTGQPVCCGRRAATSPGGKIKGGRTMVCYFAERSSGGKIKGGSSKVGVPIVSQGGKIKGGLSAVSVPVTSSGGKVKGGSSSTASKKFTSSGGKVKGGSSVELVKHITSSGGKIKGGGTVQRFVSSGGKLKGGSSVEILKKVTSSGGKVKGGDDRKQPKVNLSVCKQPISTKLRLDFTGKTGTCSCIVPASVHFAWKGTNVWQSITSDTHCSGGNLNTWFVDVTGTLGSPSWRIHYLSSIIAGFTSRCPPTDPLATFGPVSASNWCGLVTGTWSGTLHEE